jgi:hypothetical protein
MKTRTVAFETYQALRAQIDIAERNGFPHKSAEVLRDKVDRLDRIILKIEKRLEAANQSEFSKRSAA